jgi:hypothetical protein
MLVVWRQFTSKQEWAMREKLFTLTRSQRVAMWQRFKQTDVGQAFWKRESRPAVTGA